VTEFIVFACSDMAIVEKQSFSGDFKMSGNSLNILFEECIEHPIGAIILKVQRLDLSFISLYR
jgi:hypothetical protein